MQNIKHIQHKLIVKITCLVLAVLLIVAVIIAVIPKSASGFEVDLPVGSIANIGFSMNTVTPVSEITVFQGEQSSVADIINNSDSPAYLTNGLTPSLSLSDSAFSSSLMSTDITLASNKVNVTSSQLDYAISHLPLDGAGIITVSGASGDFVNGDLSALQQLLDKNGMTVGFVAIRLSDGAAIAYNPYLDFQSCSTIKAPYCLYVAKLIAEGKLDAEKAIPYTSSDYMSGSGIIKTYPFGTYFRIKTLVNHSIGKSDNIAHNMLTSAIGTDGFYDMLSRMNCTLDCNTQNTVWPNTDAYSAVLWWSQIYSFKNEGETGKWLWNLFNTNYSKISVAIGGNTPCYTKTGSSTYCSHETGIVMGDEPYIIALYTKTTSSYGVSDSYFYSLVREIDSLIAG